MRGDGLTMLAIVVDQRVRAWDLVLFALDTTATEGRGGAMDATEGRTDAIVGYAMSAGA